MRLCLSIYYFLDYKLAISLTHTTLPDYLSTLQAYTQVHLQRNMRSSGMIAASADPQVVDNFTRFGRMEMGSGMTSALPPLIASTVPGNMRPHWVMSNWSFSLSSNNHQHFCKTAYETNGN